MPPMKILIVADNASSRFGGEAQLPLQHFRMMRKRGAEVKLITHARNRDDLAQALGPDLEGVVFVPDSPFHVACSRLSRFLPDRISAFTFGFASRFATQIQARRIARELIDSGEATLVYQPTPVSPREVSLMYGLGVPVVIGPMNGNMEFPPAFGSRNRGIARYFTVITRNLSAGLHKMIPGKLRADLLLVANDRTRQALPAGARGQVLERVENGVQAENWPPKLDYGQPGQPIRFAYLGRLVDWKAVDIAIRAFAKILPRIEAEFEIIGDGPTRAELECLASSLELGSKVRFHGWKPQSQASELLRASDALVLPSLHECGGAVVLEAMTIGLPVIATRWGGPADYLDPTCGVLVDPTSEEALIDGIAQAMAHLAESADLRRRMGVAGRQRAMERFSWEKKVDDLLAIFAAINSPDFASAPRTSVSCRG